MRGDFEADLRHLPAAVGAWFVVDDHDLVAEEDADSDREAGLPGEFVHPGEGSGTQVQRIQIDVDEAQYRRSEPVSTSAVFLHHHLMDGLRTPQRLAAEVIGTAFLGSIGAGSVPATVIVIGSAPLTMADLGIISLAFGTVGVANRLHLRACVR
ncbi:hypothetical protein AB0C34_03505 [Nocardia sp. NPDC049220]|uniref:hypothetical protein n=1 Tax=Nocardia sp. NPDC049220 TaxID=3155273 RepID=UPI0033E86D06